MKMAAVTGSLCCSFLLFVFVCVSAEWKTITGESGQNVILPCRVPINRTIRAVKWRRSDLGDQYVFFYRNNQSLPDNQHPSFVNRVDLQDRQMKDGDVSVILKNVTINDGGTYECRVFNETGSQQSIINITLSVAPPGTGAPVGLIVGLSVAAVLLVAAAVGVFFIYRKCKQQNQNPDSPVNRSEAEQGQGRGGDAGAASSLRVS